MSLYRRAAKRDESEGPVVDALRMLGFSVMRHSGAGEPDLVLAREGIVRVAEVKSGNKPLQPGQVEFWDRWKGNKKIVLRDVEDVPVLASLWTYLSADLGSMIDLQRERRQRKDVSNGTGFRS